MKTPCSSLAMAWGFCSMVLVLAGSSYASEDSALMYLDENGNMIIDAATGADVIVAGTSIRTLDRVVGQFEFDLRAVQTNAVAHESSINSHSSILSSQSSIIASQQSQLASQQATLASVQPMLSCFSLPGPFNFSTQGATSWDSATVEAGTFLVVSMSFGSAFSKVFVWNTATRRFDHLQDLGALGGIFAKFFTIDKDLYLALAIEGFNFQTYVYLFDSTSRQFLDFQELESFQPSHLSTFTILNDTFLVISNTGGSSQIFKFSSTPVVQLELLQYIVPAVNTEPFMLSSLLLAACTPASDAANRGVLYQYDPAGEQFKELQTLYLTHCQQFKPLRLSIGYFLVAVNADNGTQLFLFNQTSLSFLASPFVLDEPFAIVADSFESGGSTYLIVGNENVTPTTMANTQASVYRFDELLNKFVLHQRLPIPSSRGLKIFWLEGLPHLAVACFHSGFSTNCTSQVFRWCGAKFVV